MRKFFTGMIVTLGMLTGVAGDVFAGQPVGPYYRPKPSAISAPAEEAEEDVATVHQMTFDELGDMLKSLAGDDVEYYSDEQTAYLVEVERDGLTIPLVFSMSHDEGLIWVKTIVADAQDLNDNPYPWYEMVAAQENIQPAMFAMWGDCLVLRFPVANRDVTPEYLTEKVVDFVDALMDTQTLWDASKHELSNSPNVPGPF